MADHATTEEDNPTSPLLVALAWLIVLVPLGFGLWQTILRATLLLSG